MEQRIGRVASVTAKQDHAGNWKTHTNKSLHFKCPCKSMHAYFEVGPIVLNGAYLQVSAHVLDWTFILTLPALGVCSLSRETADPWEF